MLMIESNRFCLFSLGSAYVKFYLWSGRNLEMKNRVYAQRQTLVWTTNQVFPLFIVYCSFCLLKNLKVRASFIYENCFGQFLFAYFLFWEISLPIMELVLCRKNCHWTFFVCYPINKLTIFFFRFSGSLLGISDDVKEQLSDAATHTSKAYAAVRRGRDPDAEAEPSRHLPSPSLLGGDMQSTSGKQEVKTMSPEVLVMKPILRFLQLLCENHNRDLQVSLGCLQGEFSC